MIAQAYDSPRRNPDSLNKRIKVTASASVTPNIGAQTIKAIHGTASPGEGIRAAWFDEYPIGPSDWYVNNRPLTFNTQTTDLLYRPNDTLHLRLHPDGSPASKQVGGTHYGNPATDVYAFAMANDLDAMQFNVVKYVTRFRKKDGLKDLKKAMHTLERLIAHEEAKK